MPALIAGWPLGDAVSHLQISRMFRMRSIKDSSGIMMGFDFATSAKKIRAINGDRFEICECVIFKE